MKIKIKDLKPNPFRDMDSYPIDRAKIEHLRKSISTTGFWDNILARNNKTELNPNGEIQIAYGHHRLVAIREVFKPDDIVDIPVKEIPDDKVLRIMAEENIDAYPTSIKTVDETIKAVFEYLKRSYPGDGLTSKGQGSRTDVTIFGGDLLQPSGWTYSALSKQIAGWLGGNWGEKAVYESLHRLRLEGQIKVYPDDIGEPILDKDSVEALPNVSTGIEFKEAVVKHKFNKREQQKLVSKLLKIQKEKSTLSRDDIKVAVVEMTEGKEKKRDTEKELLKSQLMSQARQIGEMRKAYLEKVDFITTLSKKEIGILVKESGIKKALAEFDEELKEV